ncbi:MAG: histidinol-phosphate aminotransferase family protein [Crenarchaeota archaeon]|nr:histidinol-phosphate aminotransferase family protein [Thermoproteota archaeon]
MKELTKRLIEWSRDVEHYADPTAEIDPNIKYGRLLFNENLLLPEEYYREIIRHIEEKIDQAIRFYPSARVREKIEEKLSEIYNVDKTKLMLTAGADEGMKLIYDMCSKITDSTLIIRPCYGMAKIYAKSMKMNIEEYVIRRDYKIEVDKVIQLVDEKNIGVVYICNPNNPLSIEFNIEDVERIIKDSNSIVIIDETYHEFGTIDHSKLLDKYDNIVILRSLSKSWGLAGLRVGYVIAPEYIIKILKGIAQPFNISSIALIALERALEMYDIVKKAINEVKEIRQEIIRKLEEVEGVVEVLPSQTNFITFRLEEDINVKDIVNLLKKRGFYVRTSSEPLLENCIRVTIGPREIMHKFINSLIESIYEYKRSNREDRTSRNKTGEWSSPNICRSC